MGAGCGVGAHRAWSRSAPLSRSLSARARVTLTGMDALHATLAARRDAVIARWKGTVEGTLAPEAMPAVELVDHLPTFLREVIAALRMDAGLASETLTPDETLTAAQHGEQRLRLGFSLDSVVREYGALREAITAVAREAGAEISYRELAVIDSAPIPGIARAVSEYSRQRDAELQKQHNEHFAFIAHELRNPLSSSMMAVEILKRDGQLRPDSRQLAALERSQRRMLEVIDHSLNVARVASGITLRREGVHLKALLEEAATAAACEAEEKAIDLRLTVEHDPLIELDLRLVRSALDNLVRNAVKYTSNGGTVELRAIVSDGLARIEVEDCCGGLPAGKVEEAFAPFVRLGRAEAGFGLGLAIAKQAVDAHGGGIRVQNLPGKGCIFALELPVGSV